jgi:hypothetical protein
MQLPEKIVGTIPAIKDINTLIVKYITDIPKYITDICSWN